MAWQEATEGMNQNVCVRMFFNRESEYGMGGFFAPILSMSTVVSANPPRSRSSHFCTSLACLNTAVSPSPVAAKNSLRSNSSNSPADAISRIWSGI